MSVESAEGIRNKCALERTDQNDELERKREHVDCRKSADNLGEDMGEPKVRKSWK